MCIRDRPSALMTAMIPASFFRQAAIWRRLSCSASKFTQAHTLLYGFLIIFSHIFFLLLRKYRPYRFRDIIGGHTVFALCMGCQVACQTVQLSLIHISMPPLYLSARIVATKTTASGFKPAIRHLISKNFSAPRSADVYKRQMHCIKKPRARTFFCAGHPVEKRAALFFPERLPLFWFCGQYPEF